MKLDLPLALVTLAACFCIGFASCKSTGITVKDVVTGVNMAGEVCEFIEYIVENGFKRSICATADEISKFGRNGETIRMHRREMARHSHVH